MYGILTSSDVWVAFRAVRFYLLDTVQFIYKSLSPRLEFVMSGDELEIF